MNILDENIDREQRRLLQSWRISVRQIGYDVGQLGIKDDAIIPLLHQLRRPTFFTRDRDFFKPRLRHAQYCLVQFVIPEDEVAAYARRVLRHPEFNTIAKRMGTIIRASPDGLTVWRLHAEHEVAIAWGRK